MKIVVAICMFKSYKAGVLILFGRVKINQLSADPNLAVIVTGDDVISGVVKDPLHVIGATLDGPTVGQEAPEPDVVLSFCGEDVGRKILRRPIISMGIVDRKITIERVEGNVGVGVITAVEAPRGVELPRLANFSFFLGFILSKGG